MKKLKTLRDLEVKNEMAYFCKLCQCWHYEGSEIHQRHKVYASQGIRPKKIVKRKKKKTFWNNW